MATIVTKGNSNSVVFWHRNEAGERIQRWLPTPNMDEAIKLKEKIEGYAANDPAYISRFLEKNYPIKKRVVNGKLKNLSVEAVAMEWISFLENEKDFPLSPNTLDAYRRVTLKNIIPYFSGINIKDITGVEVVNFKNHLYKSNFKQKTVNKYAIVLMRLLDYAYTAKYIAAIPQYYKPGNRKSRNQKIRNPHADDADKRGWADEITKQFLDASQNDYSPECIAAEMAMLYSLRIGETVGLTMKNIHIAEKYIIIDRELQRIKDKDIATLPSDMLYHCFPKTRDNSNSTLVLMPPKTGESIRRMPLVEYICLKIQYLMERNEKNKEILGEDYQDSDLLFCFEDGRPMDTDYITKAFRKLQDKYGIPKDKQITFQGLRRSGQKVKMDLSEHNTKLVAEMGGHSEAVLQSHYNYSTDADKRQLMEKIEQHFSLAEDIADNHFMN